MNLLAFSTSYPLLCFFSFASSSSHLLRISESIRYDIRSGFKGECYCTNYSRLIMNLIFDSGLMLVGGRLMVGAVFDADLKVIGIMLSMSSHRTKGPIL